MKMGLISRARTCSSAVIFSLVKQYNLVNKYEIYNDITRNLDKDYYALSKGDFDREKRFKEKFLKFTDKLFLEDNFICKIWPAMLIATPHRVIEPFEKTKEKIIFDLTTYLKIREYDQLYFLDRNLYDSTASWAYSKKSMIWRKQHRQPIVKLEPKDFNTVKFYILEYCLHQKIKEFLIEQNIPFIDIKDKPEPFIDSSIPITKSNNKYQELITNYDELYNFITDYYEIYVNNTKDWKFT